MCDLLVDTRNERINAICYSQIFVVNFASFYYSTCIQLVELIELKIVIKYIQMNSGKPSKKETLGVKVFAYQTSVISI